MEVISYNRIYFNKWNLKGPSKKLGVMQSQRFRNM